ncbi:Fe2+-dependent dioxygenase [Hyphomicrobium sulfonivorans]|uniref:Fe2+-dependent dioxygenase n=1 Tax=Hyphomicrobium sulfonivorans TaxID=121290 RepID=UPI00156EA475|nr:Fe2+-dependent dioxygenase [Hyphomicrobium sulfonivorans]MBI1649214.1 Fe2+-dependent dioxygenase [Hyphomicrobium sulfonivorans]NSL70255.1 Fe2+-dependent dioxygenase [Hyphomicrobium sulfonivorans]
MLVTIPDVLSADEVAHIRSVLESTNWVDGRVTAGDQAVKVKNNLQVPINSPEAQQLGQIVLGALGKNPKFMSAVLPLRVLPPMFNRYDEGMTFGAHVDGSIRALPGTGERLRTDVSSTLFLTPPEDYDGGELVVHDTYGTHTVKLPAGHMVVYPATSLHSVTPVTRGSRWASFFWSQSMVKDDWQRHMLFDLDQSIMRIRAQMPDDDPAVVSITGHYHNLIRAWAEV